MIVACSRRSIFGAIVGVSCQKGLSAKGGPTGVANSVNAAVVESILCADGRQRRDQPARHHAIPPDGAMT